MARNRTLTSFPTLRLPYNQPQCITSQQVEGSFRNGSKGVKYRLKAARFRLWLRLVNDMIKDSLKPVSWGYFYVLTSSKQ